MASIIHDAPRPVAWTWRLLHLLADFRLTDSLSSEPPTNIGALSDRHLRDIGVERVERAWKLDRDMAELRRKGIGPFV